jgi:hypothetical protein
LLCVIFDLHISLCGVSVRYSMRNALRFNTIVRRRSCTTYCAYFARNNLAGPDIPRPAFLLLKRPTLAFSIDEPYG